jgi:hypothetical protein
MTLKKVKKFLLIFGGVILIAAGVAGIILWWWDELYLVVKGFIGLCIALAGVVLIAVGATETKEEPVLPEASKTESAKTE